MPNAIVVATDLSASARVAIRQAHRIAGQRGADLHAITVVDPDEPARLARVTGMTRDEADHRVTQKAAEQLDHELAAAGADATAHPHVIIGPPTDAVTDLCRRENAALLVMGYHGWGESGGGPGGIARACTRHAPCSVLLNRDHHEGPFTNIVAAVDFSEASNHAVRAAADLARADHARLTLLHAYINPFDSPFLYDAGASALMQLEQYQQSLQADLETLADRLAPDLQQTPATELILEPNPAKAIASHCRTHHADLAVIGAIGRSALRHLLMGSTAERVLHHSPAAVLVVRTTTP
jgi:nucleotide-binding universal stress UspA family protein